jgi:hypothetical protein
VATEPVWPPPSPPWTLTMSTPSSTIFRACLTAPTVGTHRMPASRKRAIIVLSGPRPKLTARTWSRLAMTRSTIWSAPGWNIWKLTPNGRSVPLRTVSSLARASSGVMTAHPRKPKAPAWLEAITSDGSATQPMAVWMIG